MWDVGKVYLETCSQVKSGSQYSMLDLILKSASTSSLVHGSNSSWSGMPDPRSLASSKLLAALEALIIMTCCCCFSSCLCGRTSRSRSSWGCRWSSSGADECDDGYGAVIGKVACGSGEGGAWRGKERASDEEGGGVDEAIMKWWNCSGNPPSNMASLSLCLS